MAKNARGYLAYGLWIIGWVFCWWGGNEALGAGPQEMAAGAVQPPATATSEPLANGSAPPPANGTTNGTVNGTVNGAANATANPPGASDPVVKTPPETPPEPPAQVFNRESVERLAKVLASKPFVAQESAKIRFIRDNIKEEDHREIIFKEDALLWANEGKFAVGFEHPGSVYDQTVVINLVEEGRVSQFPFKPHLFNYPNPSLQLRIIEEGLGFSGFSLYFPVQGEAKEKGLVFQGASNFQALARRADLGLTSKGLIIDPALPEGEQYPYFRQFWLVKPGPMDVTMTIHALLEAPSLTGAFTFVVKPGTSTVLEVSATLFTRQGQSWPRKLGLAPVSGMYLYSEKENGSPYDWRPEVHSCDALLYATDLKTFFHRPLNNPRRLLVTDFRDTPIIGYGLIQKDNLFDHYQDIGARYERRASVYVEPGDGFGSGHLELLEIPSSKEIHENIQAFWVRDMSSQNGARELRYDYQVFWTAPGVIPHTLGQVVANRLLTRSDPEHAEFYVDFEGEALNALSGETGLASQVETEGDFPVLEKRLFKNPVTGGWRLRFKVRSPLGGGMMDAILTGRVENWRSPRLRARLVRGENLPDPITETFIYDFHQ
ncbi:MAG: glucan biosynthesis protein [Deltaproteobacteria bacterium]|jgi:glucans biosynthesis protein|nr:glucan biosynthesis protein [Deltaproteobacteria bacterium]